MRSLFLTTALMAVVALPTAYAKPLLPPLNRVNFQLSAERWATTDSAKVIVSVNATLDEAALSTAHQTIMGNLKKISPKAAWHITRFNRSKGQSGLEQLQVLAEARLPETELATLRSKAKSISKPGITFRVADIQFTPSQPEMEKTRSTLRAEIYQDANAEIGRLNKAFPQQCYFLNSIKFRGDAPKPQPRFGMAMMAKGAAPSAPPLSVSDKLRVNAEVVLASAPKFVDGDKAGVTNILCKKG